MATVKTTGKKLAELEAKTEKTPEDLKQIDELKLQIEIDAEEAEKKAKEEAAKKEEAEKKAKEEAAKKEEAEKKAKEEAAAKAIKKTIPDDLHKELGEVLKIKLRLENKPEKFKFQEKLDKLGKEADKFDGLKSKKDQTIHINTVQYFFTKDYPNPKGKTDLFNEKQLEQYFK